MGENAPTLLNEYSTLEEIEAYIKSLNESLDAQTDMNTIFENLDSVVIDSYNFTYTANLIARKISENFAIRLNNYLEAYERDNLTYNRDYAFISYYLLAYFYREYEDMTSLKKLVIRYNELFSTYALSYQIRGRLLRREKGRRQEALDCDLQAMRMLEQKQIENIGVNVTYASTVSLALENNEDFIDNSDVEKSIDIVKQAILMNPRYGKYNYLLAKLLMFNLLRNEKQHEYAECIDITIDVKELLRKAIELENPRTDAYASQVIEFKSYMRQADWVLSEIRMMKSARQQAENMDKEIQKKINKQFGENQEKIDKQFSENQERINEKLSLMQDKYMEILALFVSIVTIIMTVIISTVSNRFTNIQIVMTIVIMNACVVATYSVFLILLKKVEKRYINILVISLIVVLAIIFFLLT